MLLTFKIKITPSEYQKDILNKISEDARLLYNYYLNQLQEEYKSSGKFISYFTQQKDLKNYKSQFLSFDLKKEVLRGLHSNYSSYFKLMKSRKDLNPRPPRFRGLEYFFTLSLIQDFSINGENKTLRISYGGSPEFKGKIEFPLEYTGPITGVSCKGPKTSDSPIRSLKISQTDGEYWASITYEKKEKKMKPIDHLNSISIDLGKKNLLAIYDPKENKGFIFSSKYLSKNQKHFDKRTDELKSLRDTKNKRSRKWYKLNQKIKSLSSKKRTQTNLSLQKVTRDLSSLNKTIVIGDLTNLKGNIISPLSKLNRQMQNNWNLQTFTHLLEYKCTLRGNPVVKVNEAWTSKTCCSCGSIKSDQTLSDRTYMCVDCGIEIDRDINGAINIHKKFMGDYNPPVETLRVSERFGWCHINQMNKNREFYKKL
jgi:putative transposase